MSIAKMFDYFEFTSDSHWLVFLIEHFSESRTHNALNFKHRLLAEKGSPVC